jgi:hypothetical protein
MGKLEELQKAFKIRRSPSEEMSSIGECMMDKEENVHDVNHTNWGKTTRQIRDDHTVIDPLLKTIEGTVWDQQAKVLASGKYPHPIHKDNHTAVEWMDHQMSEFADALVYHECLKQTIREVYELIDYAFQKSKDDQVDALLIQALNRLKRG